jgi:hypothetical protein
MKTVQWFKKHLLWAIVFTLVTAVFISCKQNDDTGSPLSVSLATTTTEGVVTSSFYSDQPFIVTATVSNADGTPSYCWYTDNEYDSDLRTAQIWERWWGNTTTASHVVKVVVKDSNSEDTAETSKTVSIIPSGSLRLYNTSGYTLTELHIQPGKSTDSAADTTFDNSYEILQGRTISSSSDFFIIYNITPGTYDLKAASESGIYEAYATKTFSLETPVSWNLTSASDSVTGRMLPVSSAKTEPSFLYTGEGHCDGTGTIPDAVDSVRR